MPARPAIAVRCMIALVEPPIASSTRSAFSTDFSVMIWLGRSGSTRIAPPPPARLRGAQAIGVHRGNRGGARQRHAERLGDRRHGARRCPSPRRCRPSWRGCLRWFRSPAASTFPARCIAQKRRQSVHAPRRSPWNEVGIIGPAMSCTAGRSAEAAPISCAGTVLSQPPTSTTASIGCARIISSTSIDIRLRNIIEVGCRNTSPSETVGKLDRQAAGGEHAALHRLDQLGEVAVAVVEAAARIGDADHRAGEHLARVAHALGERAAQVERERRDRRSW